MVIFDNYKDKMNFGIGIIYIIALILIIIGSVPMILPVISGVAYYVIGGTFMGIALSVAPIIMQIILIITIFLLIFRKEWAMKKVTEKTDAKKAFIAIAILDLFIMFANFYMAGTLADGVPLHAVVLLVGGFLTLIVSYFTQNPDIT